MKYQLSFLHERLSFLQSQLGWRITVLNQEGEYTKAEITINDGFDLLNVFHAGIMCGVNS